MTSQRFWHSLQITLTDMLSNYQRHCYKESQKRLCFALAEYKLSARCVLVGIFVLFTHIFCFHTEAYIEGPWLWMITKGANINTDYLAITSRGAITERYVTEHGINEHDTLGQLRWTRGRIRPTVDCLFWILGCYSNNVNQVINEVGLSADRNLDYHTAYALINVISSRNQRNVRMGVGSDDAVKVWLNGEVVHINNVDRGTAGIQDLFRVNLNAGDNLLLVKVTDNQRDWGMFFEIYLGAENFTTNLPTNDGVPLTGYPTVTLATQMFDRYRQAFQQPKIQRVLPNILDWLEIPENRALLTPERIEIIVDHPELLGTFGADAEFVNHVKDTPEIGHFFRDPDFQTLIQDEAVLSEFTMLIREDASAQARKREDVNRDGVVNIQDLTLVSTHFGKIGRSIADVNGDGVVNIVDLTLVAAAIGDSAGAPSVWSRDLEIGPTRNQVEQWLHQAWQVNFTDPAFQRGLLVLQQLLAMLTPKETVLLPNYPNPFNPETWIPYQLSKPTDVTLRIYSVNGALVRTLVLGHQPAGVYESKSRAAYWDGKNERVEPVASGIYFYTLKTGEFTSTRKMLIRK